MDLNCYFPWQNSREDLSAAESDNVLALKYLGCKTESQGLWQASLKFVQTQVRGCAVPVKNELYQGGEL